MGTIGIFAIVFGFIAFTRYLRYRETVALAEKGLVRLDGTGGNGKDTLRWGIALAAVGLALSVGIYPVGFWIDPLGELPPRFGPWMLLGLLPMFFGLALIIIYVLTSEEHPPAKPSDAQADDTPALPPE